MLIYSSQFKLALIYSKSVNPAKYYLKKNYFYKKYKNTGHTTRKPKGSSYTRSLTKLFERIYMLFETFKDKCYWKFKSINGSI